MPLRKKLSLSLKFSLFFIGSATCIHTASAQEASHGTEEKHQLFIMNQTDSSLNLKIKKCFSVIKNQKNTRYCGDDQHQGHDAVSLSVKHTHGLHDESLVIHANENKFFEYQSTQYTSQEYYPITPRRDISVSGSTAQIVAYCAAPQTRKGCITAKKPKETIPYTVNLLDGLILEGDSDNTLFKEILKGGINTIKNISIEKEENSNIKKKVIKFTDSQYIDGRQYYYFTIVNE